MIRRPSIRELRANLPENVTILSSAAPRRVEQRCTRASRAATKALRENHAHKFSFRWPGERAQDERAAILGSLQRDPAVILAHAILAVLDKDTRLRVIGQLAECAHLAEGRQAFELAQYTMMNVGQRLDLARAMDRLRDTEQ